MCFSIELIQFEIGGITSKVGLRLISPDEVEHGDPVVSDHSGSTGGPWLSTDVPTKVHVFNTLIQTENGHKIMKLFFNIKAYSIIPCIML